MGSLASACCEPGSYLHSGLPIQAVCCLGQSELNTGSDASRQEGGHVHIILLEDIEFWELKRNCWKAHFEAKKNIFPL